LRVKIQLSPPPSTSSRYHSEGTTTIVCTAATSSKSIPLTSTTRPPTVTRYIYIYAHPHTPTLTQNPTDSTPLPRGAALSRTQPAATASLLIVPVPGAETRPAYWTTRKIQIRGGEGGTGTPPPSLERLSVTPKRFARASAATTTILWYDVVYTVVENPRPTLSFQRG